MSRTVYINRCCGDPGNRGVGPGPRGWDGLEGLEQRDDIRVTWCTVCECRHVEATADPGRLGVTMQAVG